jgi:hypothetical protein
MSFELVAAEMSLPRFRGHPVYAANSRLRQAASASFGLR